jgi:hypothetical protein
MYGQGQGVAQNYAERRYAGSVKPLRRVMPRRKTHYDGSINKPLLIVWLVVHQNVSPPQTRWFD